MGLVMADAAAAAGVKDVRIWGPAGPMIEDLRSTRTNHDRLAGFTLPSGIGVHDDPAAALRDATIVIHAIPVQATAAAWGVLKPHLESHAIVASTAKGIEVDTHRLPTRILADCIGEHVDLAVVSGPTIATELVHRKPAVMVAAADDPLVAARLQHALHAPWIRIYASEDVVGVELAGAAKNVIAIAAGICDGLELGDNAKSAVLARGLAEITRLGVAYGAKPQTFFGIAGVGDLATTCFSPFGRNRTFGEALGRGETVDAFLARTGATVEGISTAQSITAVAGAVHVEMPIANAIYSVLFSGVPVKEAFDALMARDMGTEW
jgi:glycerol-3-phosphate dehydrogenase (NAD(P)+)